MPKTIYSTSELAALIEAVRQDLAALKLQITYQLSSIIAQEQRIMSALTDLEAAATAIAAAVNSAVTLIQNMQAGTVSAADVENVVAELNASTQSLSNAVSGMGTSGSTGATGP